MNWKTVSLMVVSTFAFAIVNTIIKEMDRFSEFQLVFFRSVSSLLITIVQLKAIRVSPWGVNRKLLLLRGIAGVVALCMMFVLIKNIPLGTAVMLQYLSPIFTALIAFVWLKEKIKPIQWVYLLICVLGVWIIKNGELSLSVKMLLLGLGAAALSGVAYNCVRVCRKTDHPLVCVFYFPLVGTPVAFILTFIFSDWIWPSWQEWGMVTLLGVFTQIAQVTMTKAIQGDQVAYATGFKYLGVIHAFLIGWLYFGESINNQVIIGVLVLLVGIILFGFKKGEKPKINTEKS